MLQVANWSTLLVRTCTIRVYITSEWEWAMALGKDSKNHRVKGPNECSVSIHLLQNNIQVYTCAINILLRYNQIAKYKLKHTSTACLSPPYFCMGCRGGLLDVWLWWGQPGAADEEQPQAWQAEQDLHYPPPWRSCESASDHLHPILHVSSACYTNPHQFSMWSPFVNVWSNS